MDHITSTHQVVPEPLNRQETNTLGNQVYAGIYKRKSKKTLITTLTYATIQEGKEISSSQIPPSSTTYALHTHKKKSRGRRSKKFHGKSISWSYRKGDARMKLLEEWLALYNVVTWWMKRPALMTEMWLRLLKRDNWCRLESVYYSPWLLVVGSMQSVQKVPRNTAVTGVVDINTLLVLNRSRTLAHLPYLHTLKEHQINIH